MKGFCSAATLGLISVLSLACSSGDTPVRPSSIGGGQSGATAIVDPRVLPHTGAMRAAGVLPDWIVNPATLPPGQVGKNNCTFEFPTAAYQWNFHPEGGCWEHEGPDGWTRQQFQRIHIATGFASCGGGSGDATAIRVCRAGGGGQPSPCPLNSITGPNGCARCVINPECH